ncbi:conserved hypothetical protein, partial [Ricinus communis]
MFKQILDRAGSARTDVDDLDLAIDNILARAHHPLLDVRGDQLAVVLVQRPIDAAFLQALGGHAGLPGAVLHLHEGIIHGVVDALDHRGQDRAGVQAVLVGVDADGQLAFFLGGLQRAQAGTAGHGKHHVHAAVKLRACQLATLGRVVPRVGGGADHVGHDFHFRADGLGALRVAAGEGADQRDVDAADEAQLLGLGGHGRGHAHQVGTFFFLERDGVDVGAWRHAVDQHEADFREFFGDLLHGRLLGEADGGDQVE